MIVENDDDGLFYYRDSDESDLGTCSDSDCDSMDKVVENEVEVDVIKIDTSKTTNSTLLTEEANNIVQDSSDNVTAAIKDGVNKESPSSSLPSITLPEKETTTESNQIENNNNNKETIIKTKTISLYDLVLGNCRIITNDTNKNTNIDSNTDSDSTTNPNAKNTDSNRDSTKDTNTNTITNTNTYTITYTNTNKSLNTMLNTKAVSMSKNVAKCIQTYKSFTFANKCNNDNITSYGVAVDELDVDDNDDKDNLDNTLFDLLYEINKIDETI